MRERKGRRRRGDQVAHRTPFYTVTVVMVIVAMVAIVIFMVVIFRDFGFSILRPSPPPPSSSPSFFSYVLP